VKWAYYDPKRTPKQPFWMNWSEDRKYPGEKLDWSEETWNVDPNLLEGAVGYTLPSLATGPKKFYHNMFDVIRNNGELLITLPQVRRQIVILEECHRQNPLPRKPHPGKLNFPQCQGA
jgi:hypothetical protein